MTAFRVAALLSFLFLAGCGGPEKVEPGESPFELGLAKALEGDREGAVADLRHAVELGKPDSLTPRLWLAALTGDAEGLEAPGDPWGDALVQFLKGEVEGEVLLVKSKEPEDAQERENLRCEARLFLGLVKERNGKIEEAKREYEACMFTTPKGVRGHRWARERLERLR